MRKVIRLWEFPIKPLDAALVLHLKTLRKMIEKSQHLNHRAHISIAHRLDGLIEAKGSVLKRLRTLLFGAEMELGTCYLILQEEEQVHTFLKAQHQKLKGLLGQMYEPALLKHLSRVDLDRVQSLEIFLKRARIVNRNGIKDHNHRSQQLKEYAPHTIPSTSFQSLMQHCKSWGSQAQLGYRRPQGILGRLHKGCADFLKRASLGDAS